MHYSNGKKKMELIIAFNGNTATQKHLLMDKKAKHMKKEAKKIGPRKSMKGNWKITDWAGNDLTYYHGKFESFEDAEERLELFLGDDYETDRQEYYIEEDEE